jgi:hypothetical protein
VQSRRDISRYLWCRFGSPRCLYRHNVLDKNVRAADDVALVHFVTEDGDKLIEIK